MSNSFCIISRLSKIRTCSHSCLLGLRERCVFYNVPTGNADAFGAELLRQEQDPTMKLLPLPNNETRGFALVIVLALIAVMVVLVVYFAMLTQVETQTAAATARHLEARQNALLGMEVAIGQLQKYAGKDQAVTFPATTVFPEKDVVEGTGVLIEGDSSAGFPEGFRDFAQTSTDLSYLDRVGTYLTPDEREDFEQAIQDYWNEETAGRNPHWTGMMDTALRKDRFSDPDNPIDVDAQSYESDPDTLFGEPDRGQLALWLVSGNEHFHDSSIFDPAGDTSYPARYFHAGLRPRHPDSGESKYHDRRWSLGGRLCDRARWSRQRFRCNDRCRRP